MQWPKVGLETVGNRQSAEFIILPRRQPAKLCLWSPAFVSLSVIKITEQETRLSLTGRAQYCNRPSDQMR